MGVLTTNYFRMFTRCIFYRLARIEMIYRYIGRFVCIQEEKKEPEWRLTVYSCVKLSPKQVSNLIHQFLGKSKLKTCYFRIWNLFCLSHQVQETLLITKSKISSQWMEIESGRNNWRLDPRQISRDPCFVTEIEKKPVFVNGPK